MRASLATLATFPRAGAGAGRWGGRRAGRSLTSRRARRGLAEHRVEVRVQVSRSPALAAANHT